VSQRITPTSFYHTATFKKF